MPIMYDKKFKRETNITTGEREKSIKSRLPLKYKHKHVSNCKQQSHIYTIFVSQNCVRGNSAYYFPLKSEH